MTLFPVTTKRLILRPFIKEDLTKFVTYRNKPEVSKYQSWSSYSLQDAEIFFTEQRALIFDTDGTWFQIAAIRQADNQLVGDVAVRFFDQGHQAEVGVTLDSNFQSQGYAFEALETVVGLLYGRFNKHRIISIIDTRNIRATKLFENLGFRKEAHHIRNVFFKGEWSDEYSYALLNSEWKYNNGK